MRASARYSRTCHWPTTEQNKRTRDVPCWLSSTGILFMLLLVVSCGETKPRSWEYIGFGKGRRRSEDERRREDQLLPFQWNKSNAPLACIQGKGEEVCVPRVAFGFYKTETGRRDAFRSNLRTCARRRRIGGAFGARARQDLGEGQTVAVNTSGDDKLCNHARIVTPGTGFRFLSCRLSQTDSRFRKYPAQPVV
jgi:hypothetical protein